MIIAVVGAGAVGTSIAKELITNGHEVILIDRSPEAIHVSDVPYADWTLADACSPSALEQAGVRDCDALVAATGDDKVNLVVSLLSKTEFAVPKVVARVNDPANEWMFTQTWGVDVPTSTPRVMAALVEEAVTVGRAVRLFAIADGTVDVFTFVVPEDSPMVGVDFSSFVLPEGLLLSAVVRDGTPLAPLQGGAPQAGDELLITVARDRFEQIAVFEKLFQAEAPSESSAPEA